MTTYPLCKATATQATPTTAQSGHPGDNLPNGSVVADLSRGGALCDSSPSINQTFQVVVIGPSPGQACSGTVQLITSNDGINWSNYGTALTATSGASPNIQTGTGAQAWAYFSAYVTAISANSTVTCIMNA